MVLVLLLPPQMNARAVSIRCVCCGTSGKFRKKGTSWLFEFLLSSWSSLLESFPSFKPNKIRALDHEPRRKRVFNLRNPVVRLILKPTKSGKLRRMATEQAGMQEHITPIVCSTILLRVRISHSNTRRVFKSLPLRRVPYEHHIPSCVATIVILISKIKWDRTSKYSPVHVSCFALILSNQSLTAKPSKKWWLLRIFAVCEDLVSWPPRWVISWYINH